MAERPDVRAAFFNAIGLRPRLETPSLYLDTSVILHLLLNSGERDTVKELLGSLVERGWNTTTSSFTRMEALERLQESDWVRREVLKRREWRAIRNELNRGMDLDPLNTRALNRLAKAFYEALIPLDEAGVLEITPLNENGWELASELAAGTHVSAADCIHVATALQQGCHLLVTSDQQLRRAAGGRIKTDDPSSTCALLRRLT